MKLLVKWMLATLTAACVIAPAYAENFTVQPGEQPISLRVFKCGSTIVSFDEYKRPDGIYRFVSWSDSKGSNFNIPMYIDGKIPDEKTGEIVYTMLFTKSDSDGNGQGKGAMFDIHHKSGVIEAHFSDKAMKTNSEGTKVYYSAKCEQTDYESFN